MTIVACLLDQVLGGEEILQLPKKSEERRAKVCTPEKIFYLHNRCLTPTAVVAHGPVPASAGSECELHLQCICCFAGPAALTVDAS